MLIMLLPKILPAKKDIFFLVIIYFRHLYELYTQALDWTVNSKDKQR